MGHNCLRRIITYLPSSYVSVEWFANSASNLGQPDWSQATEEGAEPTRLRHANEPRRTLRPLIEIPTVSSSVVRRDGPNRPANIEFSWWE